MSQPEQAPKPAVSRGCALTILGVFVAIAVIAVIVLNRGSSSDVKFDVDAACQHFVKQQLKSPSTAQFASVDDASISGHPGQAYIEASYVDADNSFGAKLRSTFVCTVHKTDAGWVLDSLTGLN